MPLGPRYARRSHGDSGEPSPRPFVDRQEPVAAFFDALDRTDVSRPRVLVYYGMGGVGKTRLRHELRDRMRAGRVDQVWADVDFSLPSLRDSETALFALRRQLVERYGIDFPTFDLAYAYLWKQVRPNVAPLREGVPLFEAGSLAAHLLASVGVPLVGLAMEAVDKGHAPLKAWWTRRGRQDLAELSRLESTEILGRLPAYLAEDLAEALERDDRRCALFFDTHEALVGDLRSEEQRLMRDEWLRELVLQLPEVLFVILGRERLDWHRVDPEWSSVLEQHELGPLPDADCRSLLSAASVTNERIQQKVLAESQGLPLLLDLALDTVERVGPDKGATLITQAVSIEAPEVELPLTERFLRHLSPAEQDTLEVLCTPRYFDEELASTLTAEFHTQLPLGQFPELVRFSFVCERSPGVYQIHDVIQECFEGRLSRRNPSRYAAIHAFLFNHYDAALAGVAAKGIGPQSERAFEEAFFHGRFGVAPAELTRWFAHRAGVFAEAGRFAFLECPTRELLAHLEASLGPGDRAVADALLVLGDVRYRQGDWFEAESLLRRGLSIIESHLGGADASRAPFLRLLGASLRLQTRYRESEQALRSCLALETTAHGPETPCLALTLKELGLLFMCTGQQRERRHVFEHALAIAHANRMPEEAALMANLANALAEEGYYARAEELLAAAISLKEADYGRAHPDTALALCVLADTYVLSGRPGESERVAREAVAILEDTLNTGHVWYGQALIELAHALCVQGRLDECEDVLRQAAPYRRGAWTAVQHDIEMARLLLSRGSPAEAERLLRESQAFMQGNASVSTTSWEFLAVLECRAKACSACGHDDQAAYLYRECIGIVQDNHRADHPRLAELYADLASVYRRRGRTKDAAVCAARAQQISGRDQDRNVAPC